MSRWVIIGPADDDFVKKSESLLRRMGPYTVRTRNGNLEFALRFAALKDEPFLQCSKWIGSTDSYEIIDLPELLSSPAIESIDRWYGDLSDLPKAVETLDKFEGIRRFERFNRLIFYTGIRQLPEVFSKGIAPKFFGWYPGGKILYITSCRSLHVAMAVIRVMGAAMDLAEKDYDELEKIGPFRMLSDVQSAGVFYGWRRTCLPGPVRE